jgi:carbamoyltransferase
MHLLSLYPIPLISYTHDASAAIISERGIQYAYEEEKLLRFQHAISTFPEKSALLGLKTLHLNSTDIDLLVLTSMNNCQQQADYSMKVEYIKELLALRQDVEVECVPHHLAHSGLAVLTSPFEECIFLTLDGGGDGLMGHWGIFQDHQFNVVEQFDLSPAILYGYITCLAGFSLFEEGKVMGLSSFGTINQRLYRWLEKNFWIEKEGAAMKTSDQVRLRYEIKLEPQLADADTLRRHKYYQLEVRFEDPEQQEWLSELSPLEIAYTGQRFFEEMISQVVQNIVRRTGLTNIALSGGAFQNIVVNGKLRATPGLSTYVSMAPHDAGLSLGAGLIKWHQRTRRLHTHPASAYLGPSFTNQEIERLLNSFSMTYEHSEDITPIVATAVAEGKVVGWFQGRAEFGARALGARSVLADPRNADAKSRLNQALKKRDWFMPYAPSVLEEYGQEYFECFSPSPYMNVGFKVRPEKAGLIPSAIHVDGSCRANTVNAQQQPRYHRLISEFHKLTGIPMILNTSFNRHGVPIVATPRQAIQHLMEGNVDVLALEDFIVYRAQAVKTAEPLYDEQYLLRWEELLFASKLLGRGRVSGAQRIIDGCSLPVTVTHNSFEIQGKTIWQAGQTEQSLRTWWDDFWNTNGNANPGDRMSPDEGRKS